MVRYNNSIGKEIYELRESGAIFSEIAEVFDIAVSTAYNYYKQYVEDAISSEEDNDSCSCTCGGKCKSHHKGIDMSQFFDGDYDLLQGEELHIYPVSDWHIGSSNCNFELIDDWYYRFEDDNMPKIILGIGDYLEIGSKSVGNSSFTQEFNVNKQMEVLLRYLKPFKKNIIGMVSGNHSNNRLLKDYDFDIDEEIARSLDCECNYRDTKKFIINDSEYSVYYTHSKGSLSKDELALSKLIRDNANVEASLVINGHVHRGVYGSKVIDMGNNVYKRRYYAYAGSMLDFEGSYGDMGCLPPLMPSYIRVNVSNRLVTSVDIFNGDEVLL